MGGKFIEEYRYFELRAMICPCVLTTIKYNIYNRQWIAFYRPMLLPIYYSDVLCSRKTGALAYRSGSGTQ